MGFDERVPTIHNTRKETAVYTRRVVLVFFEGRRVVRLLYSVSITGPHEPRLREIISFTRNRYPWRQTTRGSDQEYRSGSPPSDPLSSLVSSPCFSLSFSYNCYTFGRKYMTPKMDEDGVTFIKYTIECRKERRTKSSTQNPTKLLDVLNL